MKPHNLNQEAACAQHRSAKTAAQFCIISVHHLNLVLCNYAIIWPIKSALCGQRIVPTVGSPSWLPITSVMCFGMGSRWGPQWEGLKCGTINQSGSPACPQCNSCVLCAAAAHPMHRHIYLYPLINVMLNSFNPFRPDATCACVYLWDQVQCSVCFTH